MNKKCGNSTHYTQCLSQNHSTKLTKISLTYSILLRQYNTQYYKLKHEQICLSLHTIYDCVSLNILKYE